MDPPPPAPPLSTAPSLPTAAQPPPDGPSTTATSTTTTTTTIVPPTKLRFMCSYRGHIIPRPHDKTLCYIGGETRIVVIDRQSTLSELQSRLSAAFNNKKPFTIKYQLPNEDLDSLISISTDEDIENMIDENDRILLSSSISSQSDATSRRNWRIRLFLFDLKSESSDIESLISNSTKSGDWFFDALNSGSVRESSVSSVNCLLGLNDGVQNVRNQEEDNQEKKNTVENNIANNGIATETNNAQDVHSVPDSPMLGTTSSYGSASSMPSFGNLPPIRVHVEESGQGQKGIEETFQQMSIGGGGAAGTSSPAPVVVGQVVTGIPAVGGGGEYANRIVSDDERSEQSVPVGYVKVPQVQPQVQLQQPIQFQQRSAGGIELVSPDSVSSDGSLTNPLSRQRQMAHQEHIMQIQAGNNRASVNAVEPNNRVQMPHVQEPEYIMSGQFDQHPQLHQQQQQQQQQQFVHASVQYIHPHAAGTMPYASYYPLCTPPQRSNPHHQAVEQQYVYYVPTRAAPAYNMTVQQQNYSESAATAPNSQPQAAASMVNQAAAYTPATSVPSSIPEMATGGYRTSAAGALHSVQVHSSQHQPQYVAYTQMHNATQSATPTSGANVNYGYEYADPMHAQVYYAQRLPPQMAAQYQTMTSSAAVVLPGASPQAPLENIKQQSSISQP